MEIYYTTQKSFLRLDLETLYKDAQWYAYTKDMPLLESALTNSLSVISAWDNNSLVGLVRVVGDGLTIIYVQDLLVLKEYQNKGIGSQLITRVLSDYNYVRQKVLLTEEEPKVRHFYESHGFISCDQGSLVAFSNLD